MVNASLKDNIFALSTPVGGAIAVLRASGSGVLSVLSRIFTGKIEDRRLNYGRIIDPDREGGVTLDSALAVCFKAPNSYTGEDMFELNLHGSYAVVTAISKLLTGQGLRQAEAGEFTKRAFLSGKMDLIQADAVMDLVLADTERSANAALEQLEGGLSKRVTVIETKLIELATELAAAMDYPDEMEDEAISDLDTVLKDEITALAELIGNGCGRILRDGAKVVILGRPNAGKSSLMNALTGTGRAIVTDIAGTTRDIIEEKLDIRGFPIRLIDTAGLHDTLDPVEMIGIERARAEANTAELIIRLFDGNIELSREELEEITNDSQSTLYVINKYDISPAECAKRAREIEALKPNAVKVFVSCKTGYGLNELVDGMLSSFGLTDGSSAIVTNERHLACLNSAKQELINARSAPNMDCAAISIDSALMHLGEITGRTAGEEVLYGIFSRFCVGK